MQSTHPANPAAQAAYQNMVADATPEFYIEHLKRLPEHQIQPYFMWGHLYNMEQVEHLIRTGVYIGPLNHNLTAIGSPGAVGRNPSDFMECVYRYPYGFSPNDRIALADGSTVWSYGDRCGYPRWCTD